MKFRYIYKTGDGVRQEAQIEAPTRDEAFARLRAQGIRPIKVIACDGSKANGADYGVGKRKVLLIVAVTAAVVAVLAFVFGRSQTVETHISFDDLTRRQPIGDALTIEKGIRTGWADAFDRPGDRFLASFAIPGVPAGVRNTTVKDLEAVLNRDVAPTDKDSIEVRQVKAMVAGLKLEIRDYLAAGGNLTEYCRRLVQRQDSEIGYHERVKTELEAAAASKMPRKALEELWEKRNETLRDMGVKLVPLPE